MWWAGQVTDMKETKNAHKILVENLKRRGILVQMAHDTDQWQALVNIEINFQTRELTN